MSSVTGSLHVRAASGAEGPTIYKCDQLRQLLDAAIRNRAKFKQGMDAEKFLEQNLPVKQETASKAQPGGYTAGSRLSVFIKQWSKALDLDRAFVKQWIVNAFLYDEPKLKELRNQLAAMREDYDVALSLLKDEPLVRPVTITIGTTNLINMRVLPSVLDAARHQFQEQFPDVRLRFVQAIMDSEELLSRTHPPTGLDAIVACCLDGHAGKISEEELVARLPLQCCLLRQRIHSADESSLSPSLPNWDAIRDTRMVALSSRRKHFDVDWKQLEGLFESFDEVPTLLEAHARVAASDSWTLSYRELLDDPDERNLEALGLPSDPTRNGTLIVAVMPRGEKRRRVRATPAGAGAALPTTPEVASTGDSKEKMAALAILKTCLREEFQKRAAEKQEAAELTRRLARFTHTYHVSEFAPSNGDVPERLWFTGLLQLECTVNGNLRGSLTIGSPVGPPMRIRVFGRPLKLHDGKVWNLNWRSSDLREESGTTNLFVTTADLESGEALVGHWVGRSSWTDGEVRPTGGPVILHSRSGLTARELRAIVTKHKDAAIPNLQLVGDRVVPFEHELAFQSSAPSRTAKPRLAASRAKAARDSESSSRKPARPR